MALNGTLEELAVLDVIQLANHAHLTGCLALHRGSEEAQLFYRKGALVHACLGKWEGQEVLVQVVDWVKGDFEFRTGQEAAEETIRMDLHRAVMHALKTRDERKQEEERRRAAEVKAATPPPPSLDEHLKGWIAPFDFIQRAILFQAGGVLASAARNGAPSEDLGPLCRNLLGFIAAHPRGELRRAILDDAKGTVILAQVPDAGWLVVVALHGVTLGAVTVGMGKLIAQLGLFLKQNGNRTLLTAPLKVVTH